MLRGIWFLVCELIIIGPALLIVGTMTAIGWRQGINKKPRAITLSLVALTVALLPDFILFISLLTRDRIIPVIANSDNVALFSKWQVVSGSLIAVAIVLSLAEASKVNKLTLRGTIILLLIHGAGTALFFS